MQIGFLIVFALLGAIISMVCGFLVGNRVMYTLFVSGISTLAFGGLGFGVYSVLEKKVPEFLELLSGFSSGGGSRHSEDDGYEESSEHQGSESSGISSDVGVEPMAGMAEDPSLARARSGKFGDHIVFDKIAIKNEPKLMAEAIRTMFARDEKEE